jgi:hypothetical protein
MRNGIQAGVIRPEHPSHALSENRNPRNVGIRPFDGAHSAEP